MKETESTFKQMEAAFNKLSVIEKVKTPVSVKSMTGTLKLEDDENWGNWDGKVKITLSNKDKIEIYYEDRTTITTMLNGKYELETWGSLGNVALAYRDFKEEEQ